MFVFTFGENKTYRTLLKAGKCVHVTVSYFTALAKIICSLTDKIQFFVNATTKTNKKPTPARCHATRYATKKT